ncbi:MAG: Gfo/Idh/MocA family oxidoreductase [Rhodobacteraceae bacterium]|nr:Gfo/Idh/MocA family oxidoreductase [Paracoccaceae bacterium]
MTDRHPSLSPPLRVAVIGLGPMGQNHVRAWQRVPGALLTAVVDTHAERVATVMRETGCTSVATSDDLIGIVDAVSIATPADTHDQVAAPLLRAGVHCLIEKPLATTPDGCAAIAAAAEAGGAVAQVGHIERFNPAIAALQARLNAPLAACKITARRLNPASGRAIALDVVSDLMSHDIDIVLALKKAVPVTVSAERHGPESVTACLSFADGGSATLTADRDAQARVRDFVIETSVHRFSVDFAARTMSADDTMQVVDHSRDALTLQLTSFAEACRAHRTPDASVAAARDVMNVVWRIHKALGDAA